MDAILIAVADIADVDLGGGEINDVAGGLAVLEQQVAKRAVSKRSSEVVLLRNGWRFDGHTASAGAISQQHLLGAVDQVAVHQSVADVESHRLQAAAIGQQLKVSRIAILGDYRVGLIGVGDRRRCGVSGSVVHTSESEINGGDLADGYIQRISAARAGHFMQQTINVVIDGAATKTCADGRIGHAGSSHDGFAHTTSKQSLAIARSGASSARTSQFNAEGALNTSVSQQLLRRAQIRTNQVTTDNITLQRSDIQIANQNGVRSVGSRIRPVSRLRLQKDQAFPS